MISKKAVLTSLIFQVLSLATLEAHALPFNIFPKAQTVLPTTVVLGGLAKAYYTVQNVTSSQRNNIYIKSLPPSVTQTITNGVYADTCGSTFNLSPAGQIGDSCTLELAITGPVNVSSLPNLYICLPGGTTCAGTQYQLNVTSVAQATLVKLMVNPPSTILYAGTSQQLTAQGLYSDNSNMDITQSVTWSAANPTVATVSATGLATATMTAGNTSIYANANGLSDSATVNVVTTPVIRVSLTPNVTTINQNFTIVFNQGGTGSNVVSAILPTGMNFVGANSCTVSQNQPACVLTVNPGSTIGSYSINYTHASGNAVITPINPLTLRVTSPLYLYVSDYSSNLNRCPMNSADGTFASACIPMANPSSAFAHTSAIAFKIINNQTYAYVGDASATLWQCPVNAIGGFGGACAALTNPVTPFLSTRSTTFQVFSGVTYAYVSDDSMILWQCPINAATGAFSGACAQLTVSTNTNSEIYQTTFATLNGTTYAYVSDHSYGLWVCPMNATGGFSSPCTAFYNSPSFSASVGVTFQSFAGINYAYVLDDSTTVWQCTLNNATGTLTPFCTALTNKTLPFLHTTIVNFQTFAGTTYAYIVDQTNSMFRCLVDSNTGAFGTSCTSINNSNFLGDALGASFYSP